MIKNINVKKISKILVLKKGRLSENRTGGFVPFFGCKNAVLQSLFQ